MTCVNRLVKVCATLFRPPGLVDHIFSFSRLTPWARFYRPCRGFAPCAYSSASASWLGTAAPFRGFSAIQHSLLVGQEAFAEPGAAIHGQIFSIDVISVGRDQE